MGIFFYIFILLHAQFFWSRTHSTMAENGFNVSKKQNHPLPIKSIFQFPSPLPSWPKGCGFSSGAIDLGGLEVSQVTSLNKVWAVLEGGPNNQGASFFEPSSIPDGFFMLGSYSQPNNIPLFGWVLAAKDSSHGQDILRNPVDYTMVWSSENMKINQEGVGYIWFPVPPDGYKSVGHVITASPGKPPLDRIRCIRADFTDAAVNDQWIWGSFNGLNLYSSRPQNRGLQAQGVSAGTFIATLNNGAGVPSSCLKNIAANLSGMPNLNQVQALIQEYSPRFYLHPDERFFPSSVTWFFQNGALLYTKGKESAPVSIAADGSNLPQGGSNDGAYWLDLPIDNGAKDKVKQGYLQDASVYLHVKPMFGGTFTDLAIWVFYPFNGAAKAKVEFINIDLGKIGEHVGDWEHVTLRISNFNGALDRVYFSQHSGGQWVDASGVEYLNGNKVVVYSSLHGHAAYPKVGDFLQGSGKVGIRNDTGKGNMWLDSGANCSVISAGYLGSIVVEPPWLNYAREWGPKISYDFEDELRKLEKLVPRFLRKALENAVRGLPKEVLGEEGPTGPKWKDNWDGDERS